MEFKDYYVTLGVPKTATEKEIKQAFRKLARKHHPDVNPGDKAAEARFKEVNEAHEVLSDPVKRKKYDELGANWRLYEQTGAPPPGSGWPGTWTSDPNAPFGGRSGTRTMTEEELHEMFGGGDPFSDFFHVFFGGGAGPDTPRGGRGARQRAARQGRDIEHELTLNLEEAYQGAKRTLSIKHDGHARSVDVRIPAGVGDGARLRVAGEGEHMAGGTPPGDLYLRIRLNRHPVFERRGRDLYTHVRVPLTTAVLGGEVGVETLGGRSLRLKVPPTTQHGQVFRLKGHGMPAVGKPNESGDLYATVDVDLPKSLSAAERAHYEALRKLEADARTSKAS